MEHKAFFYELGKLVYKIDGVYEDYGRSFKLGSPNLLWILYALNDGGRHSQKQICDDWAIPRSTANTIIKDLESKNYITLSKINGERRELLISLTPGGKEYANAILSDLYKREEEVFSKTQNPEELIAMLGALSDKMTAIAAGSKK